MFMLSFIFVIVCVFVEWKQIYRGFFIYVLPLEIQLSTGKGWDSINRLNLTTFLPVPNQDLYLQCHMSWSCFGVFRELRRKLIVSFNLLMMEELYIIS